MPFSSENLLNCFPAAFSLFFHSKILIVEVRVLKLTPPIFTILAFHSYFLGFFSILSSISSIDLFFHFYCYIFTFQVFSSLFSWFLVVVVAFGKAVIFLFYGYAICFYASENMDPSMDQTPICRAAGEGDRRERIFRKKCRPAPKWSRPVFSEWNRIPRPMQTGTEPQTDTARR